MGDDGCVKDETKLKMTKLVGFVSILLFLLAVVMIAFAVVAWSGMKEIKAGSGKYATSFSVSKNAALAAVALIGGVLALLLSILGCCTVKFKNPCVTCPFVICSFLIGLICLIGGALVIGGKTRDQILKKACNTKIPSMGNRTGKQIALEEYRSIVDKAMCSSDLCPCDSAGGRKTLWQTKAPEKNITKYQRSWTMGGNSPNRQNVNAVVKMHFTASGTKYTTYKQCYDAKISKLAANSNAMKNKYLKQAKSEFSSGGWKFLADMESSMNCAGICVTPLFFLTKDLNAGPPTSDCINAFTAKFNNNVGLAVTAFLSAVVLICAGICAIPLCTGYSKKDEEE